MFYMLMNPGLQYVREVHNGVAQVAVIVWNRCIVERMPVPLLLVFSSSNCFCFVFNQWGAYSLNLTTKPSCASRVAG